MPMQQPLTAGLDRLIAPVGRAEFLDRHWDRAPLPLPGGAGAGPPVTVAEIDALLAHDPARVWLECPAHGLRRLPLSPGDAEDIDIALRRVEDGATIIFAEVERRLPALAALTRALHADLGFRCRADIHVSSAAAHPTTPQAMPTGQFILQIEGQRAWSLAPERRSRPVRSDPRAPAMLGEDAQRVVLAPGDALYLPRGWGFSAESRGTGSAHLAIEIHAPCWLEAVTDRVGETPAGEDLRDLLPPGWCRLPREALAGELGRRWPACPDAATALDLTGALVDRETRRFPMDMAGRLAALLGRAEAAGSDAYRARADLVWDLVEQSAGARLICGPLTLDVPSAGVEPLRRCLGGQNFRLSDLPGALPGPQKAALVRDLLDRQLIQPAPRPC